MRSTVFPFVGALGGSGRLRRGPIVPILLAVLVLAGCVQSGPQTAAVADLPPALDAPLARLTSVIDPEGGQGEPSMGFHPDGTIFANGLSQAQAIDGGAVFVSEDGGATWTKVAAPTEPMPNFDPDLAVAKDGTVWFSSLWLGCSSAGSSKDKGKTWTTSPLACVPPAGDRQYVIPTKGGTAYIYSHHVPTFYQAVAKTTDYGATWTPVGFAEPLTSIVEGGSGWGGGGFWNEATGSVFFTFSYFDGAIANGGPWHPATAVSRGGSDSFELVKLPNGGGKSVGLSLVVGAADDAGNVYLSWAEAADGGKHMIVYLARSTDDGKTWSEPIVVDDDAGSKVFPAITAGASGRVAVAYYHSDAREYPSNVPEGASWNVTLAWTQDALAQNVAWERGNLTASPFHQGPICPDGTACQTDRRLLDYFALHVAPDGRVGSVWTSTLDVKGKVANVFGITDEPLLR